MLIPTSDEFNTAVREVVSPVLAAAGLTEVSSEVASQVHRVRFASDRVCAEVVCNAGELRLRFNRFDAPDPAAKFYMWGAIALVDSRAAALNPRYFARTAAEARVSLERLAREIERYCGAVLRGDPAVYAAMAAYREDQRVKRGQWERRSDELGLDDAVARRDWARVAEIWAMATHDLYGADQRRFDLARQNARTLRCCTASQREGPELSEALDLEYRAFGPWVGEDPEREAIEHAVGEAMDAEDWSRVARLYESAAYELDYLELTRLEIARTRLGEPGAGARPAKAPRALLQQIPWQFAGSEPAQNQSKPAYVALGHSDRDVLVAGLVEALLGSVAVGGPISVDAHRENVEALELWIPGVLRRALPGRRGRRAYGFAIASVARRGLLSIEVVGTCALVFEQAPAPFALSLRLGESGGVAEIHVRIGEGRPLESGTTDALPGGSIAAPANDAWEDDLTVEFVAPGDGEFSKPERNLIVSRDGFFVRSRGMNDVFYIQAGRELRMFVELLMTDEMALTMRRSDVHGWPGPDGPLELPDAERTRIIRNVQRAFAWDGTTLVVR